jgi:hypothetical protein
MTSEEIADVKAKKMISDPSKPVVKKTILKMKKTSVNPDEPKPKGVLIWNSFLNTVKMEMIQADPSVEPSYNDTMKRAKELKESDPDSYKLFCENWTPN